MVLLWFKDINNVLVLSEPFETALYMRPSKSGFARQVVGIHYLEKLMPNMMLEAGFHGKFTLHSLRGTCASRLYQAGVEEQASIIFIDIYK